MSQFPRLPFISADSRKTTRVNSYKRLRSALALGLIALLLSAFGFSASAQQQTANGKFQFVEAPKQNAFIIYQQPDGTVTCREATPAERQQLDGGDTRGLRQINHLPSTSPDTDAANATQAAGLKIILQGTPQLENFPDAKNAFIRAAANWEAKIQNDITIIIKVDYGPTNFGQAWGANILGSTRDQSIGNTTGIYNSIRARLVQSAASQSETTLYNQLPVSTVPTNLGNTSGMYVATPILRALGMIGATATDPEPSIPGSIPQIGFNSTFTYDFDPTNGIDSNKTDFDAVATHEIGHVLGFLSFAGDKELDANQPLVLTAWDLFRLAPGTSLGTFSSAQRFLSSGNTPAGNPVFWAGGTDVKVSTGRADNTGGDEEQSSHWKDDLGVTSNYIGIMDPNISRGRRQTITNNDLLALDAFGYRLIPAAPPPPPPANDNFASAQSISGCTGSVTGTNVSATKETGEPAHANNAGGASAWYRWQATSTGSVTITTAGSTFDTTLGVYTGTTVGALTNIAGNDDENNPAGIYTSKVTFNATAGMTYQIAVDGYGADTGSIVLNWTANCTTPTTNPIDGSQFFVAQHYRDFLGREPDAGGLQYWSEQISGNSSNAPSPCPPGNATCEHVRRISVSAAFFVENEFQRTGGFVYRFYKATYGTRPTFQQFTNDRAQVYEGTGLEQRKQAFAAAWIQSAAFTAKYPTNLSGSAFIDAIVQNVLQNSGVDLSAQKASLLTDFNAGGRAQVVRSIADNAAFSQVEYNRAFVVMQYFGYLQRDPDEGGYQFWLGILNNQAANNFRAMVCAFITSTEYQQRFGSVITRSNNDCSFVGP